MSGPLSDQIGQKRVLLLGLLIYILASLGCGGSTSMTLLLSFRFFQGMGSSVGPVLARAIASSLYPEDRSAQVQSYGAMGVGIASMLSIIGSGYLTLVSWRGNFFLASLLGALLLIWTLGSLPLVAQERKEKVSIKELWLKMRAVFKNRQFLANTSCHTMTYGLMYGYIALFPFLLIEIFHEKNPAQVGIYSAYMIGFYLIGTLIAARLVLKLSTKNLIFSGICLQFLAGVGLLCGFSSFWILMFLAMFNISIGLILPLTSASALAPFAGISVGTASSTLGLSYRFVGSLISTLICSLPLTGGRNLGVSMVVFSLVSLFLARKIAVSSKQVLQ